MNTEHDALMPPLPEREKLAKERDQFVKEMGIKGLIDLHVTAGLNLPVLTKSLLDQGAGVHARDEKGHTPLHYAAWENASETAEVLLNSGADVKARDEKSATPLHSAALGNARKTVEVLLNNGADVHARDEKGHTPLHYAADGNASETAEVLLNSGADVNGKDKDGRTSLHLVVWRNAFETAEVLLNYDADVYATDKNNVTPLQVAAVLKGPETARVMNDYFINSILATGDGSRERPYKVKSIKEEHDILKHFEKELSMQSFLPNESMDKIVCKDGTVFYFDIFQAKAGRRMTTKSGDPVIDRELEKLEELGPQMKSIDQAITEKHSYRGPIICPLCNGPLGDHLYGLWECLQCKKTFNVKDLKRADSARAWGKIVGIALLIAFLVGLAKVLSN